MKLYAVPMIAFVRAESLDDAYETAGQQARMSQDNQGLLIDELLPAFSFDPALYEVHSALDKDEVASA